MGYRKLACGGAFCLGMGNLAMDSELKTRISSVVKQLAEIEQRRLRAAGTFVELEELACEIGDEVTRQLLGDELAERCADVAHSESQPCPDCGQSSSQAEPQHRELDSSRGTIEYGDPAYHCPTCRRSFFPGSRLHGIVRQGHRDAEVGGEDHLGG
jgi:uncharacterized protein with PIN domain